VVEPFTGELIETCGPVVSTLNVIEAEPVPEALVAATTTECTPSGRPVYVFVLVQADAAPPSRAQVTLVGEPVAENVTSTALIANAWFAIGALMVTSGAGATVNVVLAWPVLPAASVAVTTMVWLPGARAL
jgi:hypothetical protein